MGAFGPLKDFVIEHVSSHIIRCSFCENMIRRDVPMGTETPRGTHVDIKGTLAREARDADWAAGVTRHGNTLNFCPDHVHVGREMGLLRMP